MFLGQGRTPPCDYTWGWSGAKVNPLAGCPVLGRSQANRITAAVGEVVDTTRHPLGMVAMRQLGPELLELFQSAAKNLFPQITLKTCKS